MGSVQGARCLSCREKGHTLGKCKVLSSFQVLHSDTGDKIQVTKQNVSCTPMTDFPKVCSVGCNVSYLGGEKG